MILRPNCVINLRVSVKNLNIRERESRQAQSGESDACSRTQIFNMSELLYCTDPRSGHWKCPRVGYVQCPIMSELK